MIIKRPKRYTYPVSTPFHNDATRSKSILFTVEVKYRPLAHVQIRCKRSDHYPTAFSLNAYQITGCTHTLATDSTWQTTPK